MTTQQIKDKGWPSTSNIDRECWAKWIHEEIQLKYWLLSRRLSIETATIQSKIDVGQSEHQPERLPALNRELSLVTSITTSVGDPPKFLENGGVRYDKRTMKLGKRGTHKLGQGGVKSLQAE